MENPTLAEPELILTRHAGFRNIEFIIPVRNRSYLPQLDVLRGIAVLLVFGCHAALHVAPSLFREWACKGWIGVDLFFVLSGFLITDILLNSKDSQNYFQAFYLRRALRIWPLYFGLLFLSFIILPAVNATMREELRGAGPSWIYALFLQNLVPYARPVALVVTWSLAVEEQFYLLWSLIIFVLSVRQLRWVFLGLLLLAPVFRNLAFNHGAAPEFLYFNLFHYDALVGGSLVALFGLHRRSTRVSLLLGAATLTLGAIVATVAGVPGRIEQIRNVFTYSGIALAATGLLLLALSVPWNGKIGWFEPLRFTGKISYCLYLVHYPLLSAAFLARTRLGVTSAAGEALIVGIALIASYIISIFSWVYVERPILTLKRHCEYRRIPTLENAAA